MRPRRDGTPAPAPRSCVLTQEYVDGLQAEERVYRVWDLKQRGLTIQVQPSGHKSWHYYYRFNRRSRWYFIGDVKTFSLDHGRGIARRAVDQIAGGVDPCLRLRDAAAAEEVKRFVRRRPRRFRRPTVVINSCVYFVRIGEAVKVGFTTQFETRLKYLRAATAEEMAVLAVIPGDRKLERHFHHQLAGARISNEFFEEKAVRDLIDDFMSGALARPRAPTSAEKERNR